MNAVWILFLLYGTGDLQLSSFTIGVILDAASLGGLTGATISTRVIKRIPLGRAYFMAQTGLLLGPTIIVLASGPRPVVVALLTVAFFVTDLGLGVANVIIVTVRQTATPHSMMSRMTACFRTLLFGGGALGALTAGLLAGAIGDRPALAVAAIASAVVVIALVRSPVSRLRELPPAAAEPQAVVA